MPLDPTSEFLRSELEAMATFDGRYENIALANYDAVADERRGCFSLVFRAFDTALNRLVALKFFDPAQQTDVYRRTAFRREHEILDRLVGFDRCLQLTAGLKTINLVVPVAGGATINLACEFFAVEWLDGQLDEFFLGKSISDPIDKLKLFNEMILSIEALHSRHVFHRDLKQDNIRFFVESTKRVVVAIDLGAAARVDSGLLASAYSCSVGASGYASPEANCGLAGNRRLAPFTDLYAAGCLLYELFNPGYFFIALENANPRYKVRLAALSGLLSGSKDTDVQVAEWEVALSRSGSGVVPVELDSAGSDVPKPISSILNEVLRALTSFDYRNRPIRLGWVRQKTWIAIRMLESQKIEKARAESARKLRALRVSKANNRAGKRLRGAARKEIATC